MYLILQQSPHSLKRVLSGLPCTLNVGYLLPGVQSFRFNMMTFTPTRYPPKILAYTNELCTKVQKFWQKDGFFVDKKETSDHL